MRYLSPLRYPGGKSRLAPYIAKLIASQGLRPTRYAEPFAGGAGAALRLLVNEEVDVVHINDLNPGVAAFWRCLFNETEQLAERIECEEVSIAAWHEHVERYRNPTCLTDLDLGFSTFFLNRCNRSGILDARPIGGLEQVGRWKIDARFNRPALAHRVRYLGKYRDRVVVTEQDARVFLRDLEPLGRDLLVYVDPPYMGQGEELYLNSLSEADHEELARLLSASPLRWFLTYDTDDRVINTLYAGMRALEFDIAHTAQDQHVGTEYAVFSDSLSLPDANAPLVRAAGRWIVEIDSA